MEILSSFYLKTVELLAMDDLYWKVQMQMLQRAS